MVKCDYPGCNEKIDYLPFKCKYCGGSFCKKHRLPENHDCPLEPRKYMVTGINTNVNSSDQIGSSNLHNEYNPQEINESEQDNLIPIIKKVNLDNNRTLYPEKTSNIDRTRGRTGRRYKTRRTHNISSLISRSNSKNYTTGIILLNIIFFILGLIIPKYILLNLNEFIFNFKFYTLITALFTPTGIFSLIFTILILVWTGKSIEYRFGGKFLITLYIISGLFGAVLSLFLYFITSGIPYFTGQQMYFSAQNAAITGIIVFIAYSVGLDRELQFFFFFIPIRMKARYIIWFIACWDLIWGFLLPDVSQIGSIAAIYVAKLLYDVATRRTVSPQFASYYL